MRAPGRRLGFCVELKRAATTRDNRDNEQGARVRKYHGQAASHTFTYAKPAPSLPDLRDPWRRRLASDPTLGARALRVALGLLNFANKSGFTSVGIVRLAEELNADRRVVERGLAALVAAGYLERERGAGKRGNGGWTCGTRLKVPAEVIHNEASPPAKVPATAAQGTGQTGRKVPATPTGQTLLTHRTPAEDAPGLEAGSAPAENERAGSRTAELDERRHPPVVLAVPPIRPPAVFGGEVLRMLDELEDAPRAEPRPVRDAVLSALRQRFGLPAKRTVNDNENSPRADGRGLWPPRVL